MGQRQDAPVPVLGGGRVDVAMVRLYAERRAEVLAAAGRPAEVAGPGRRRRQLEVTELVLVRVQRVDRRERRRAGVTAPVRDRVRVGLAAAAAPLRAV